MTLKNELRRKLAQEIALYIKDANLEVGSRLTEKALCDAFNVSRTPVRAALKSLSEAGIIRHVRNRGYFTQMAAAKISEDPVPQSDEELLYLRLTRDRFEGELDKEFTEADLVRRFDVPRSTLTRVLQRLLLERLIEKRPGRGWSFAEILDSEQAHDESYRFRLCIEPAALLESTFTIDEERLTRCRNQHEDILAGKAKSISSIAFFEINADFHQMLADFSGNRFFREAMRQQNNLRRVISYQWVYGAERVGETCQEHLAIIEAIVARDGMWAASLLRNHLSGASQLSPYRESPGKPTDPWHIDVLQRKDIVDKRNDRS